MKKRQISLKLGLTTMIVICWLVPIIIVIALAGVLFEKNNRTRLQQELDSSARYALHQVYLQLEDAINDSKTMSYDGIVRSAYRSYQQDGNSATLYRSINDYLSQKFSRSTYYQAVFISFWDESVGADSYLLSSGTTGYNLLQTCHNAAPGILERMGDADTDICFLLMDDHLYMARNLLDSHFEPYASVVMVLEPSALFQPLYTIPRIHSIRMNIDGTYFSYNNSGSLSAEEKLSGDIRYEIDVDGHAVSFAAELNAYDMWEENPWLSHAALTGSLMVLPLLVVIIILFRYHISRPIETLARANKLVQTGQRGYEITQKPPNAEFAKLYAHFNSMSAELKSQFERSYQEQQAAQRAQIKALQSQINPHFLNNTLEIINWEARMAENERVSAMIEALSTMLNASLDRDGCAQIPLREELGYVDAYLYIIRERLGENFQVYQQIDQELMDQMIPRLILQPIVENAVEHDITARRGGSLWVRVRRDETRMILEVEHDGTMTEADREKIRLLLSESCTDSGRVGLRNVHQRLKLIYGSESSLRVAQTDHATVMAQITFPLEPGSKNRG